MATIVTIKPKAKITKPTKKQKEKLKPRNINTTIRGVFEYIPKNKINEQTK